MSKPIVAIVGRPNVGKSTLFNVLAGETISIVKDTPGVTRDRIYADCNWLNMNFTLVDTGGIEPDSRDIILAQMREQAQIAIDTADVIIFIVDVRQGLQDSDSKVADMLRKSGKPVVLAVNKVDSIQKFGNDVYEFYNLGIGDPIPVSAASRLGIGDLLDEVSKHFTLDQLEEEEDERPRVAIIGKPNVGKSSIINKLLGENRVIVSNIAGTTRDAVDTEVVYNGTEYIFIDTAGLRRKSKIKEDLERLKQEQTYTQDNMLIKYNPFGTNTQSLYVYFETENPAQISYTIHVADSSIEDFKRTCYQESEMQTQHELQVIGLIPDLENEITFTIAYEDGTVEEKTVSYDLLRNSLKAVGVVEKNILLFYNGGKCKGGEENDTVEQHQ